ncbi:MAG: hypothetical protein O2793_15885 [Proteobacteria bacterium]|uniref:hypothetical protein n=1 Tax=Acinetobacter venetianus TaxID=52133 RepID=UPI0010A650DD|nr:hypothetical protein [Acinetobacter venetianus]MCR4530956.1 hypothetical protein [Acinetobacter venetianus]MDA0697867.1 hypothetical protein [Pseudomonadota bacterium]
MNADWLDCLALLSKQCFEIVQDVPSVHEQRLKLRKAFVTFSPLKVRQCLYKNNLLLTVNEAVPVYS